MEYEKTIAIKEGVYYELSKITSSMLIQGDSIPNGSKFIAGDNIMEQAKNLTKKKEKGET